MLRFTTHPLGLFLISVHALYFVLALYIGQIHLVDSWGYLNQAHNLLAYHSTYAEDWNAPLLIDYFTIRPPLYAILVVACKSIYHSDYAILFVQNIFSLFNLFLLWKLMLDCGAKQKHVNISLVLAVLLGPSQMIHANLVMTEMLFQTLLMGIFFFSFQCYKTPTWAHMLMIALLISLAMLTKPVIFLFGIVLFVYFFLRLAGNSRRMLFSFLLIPLTWHMLCVQNKHVTGYYHYSSIKIMADLRVNARYILSNKYGEDSSANFVSKVFEEAAPMQDYGQRYRHIEARCTQVYTENKGTFALLYIKGMVATLLDPGRFDLSFFMGLQDATTQGFLHRVNTEGIRAVPDILRSAPLLLLCYLALILVWNLLLCLAILFFVFDKETDVWLRFLVLLFVGYLVGVTGISGLCRYRVPVYPEIIFVFGLVLPYLQTKFFARKHDA